MPRRRTSAHEGAQAGARKLVLGDESDRAGLPAAGADVGPVAARGEDDGCGDTGVAQLAGNAKTVRVGQLEVEQDDLGLELRREGYPARAVLSLADDVEPVRLQDAPGAPAEARVIVDYEDASPHAQNNR